MKVKAGQILALTQGEYSDYCLRDHVRVLKDFDTIEVANNFIDNPKQDSWDVLDRFVACLIKDGLIEPLDPNTVVEWCLGSPAYLITRESIDA